MGAETAGATRLSFHPVKMAESRLGLDITATVSDHRGYSIKVIYSSFDDFEDKRRQEAGMGKR